MRMKLYIDISATAFGKLYYLNSGIEVSSFRHRSFI